MIFRASIRNKVFDGIIHLNTGNTVSKYLAVVLPPGFSARLLSTRKKKEMQSAIEHPVKSPVFRRYKNLINNLHFKYRLEDCSLHN